ncbi:DUF4974 domain-containing protein [Pedobacter sp. MC2016-14]|uniref:FecR family protein n=1 Tax=Pedobacter sp. MC2016-14 TaxID=2897327 RepID=UPI001E65A9EE|nr:FecR family protein [Pedobacter sp. MC2016-14]MCD0489289.1 DUF4974 domain-containing protein [Pedobacter sp. MC2016-14]
MNTKDIENILDKYKAGVASEEEVALLQDWSMSYEAPGTADLSMDERIRETDKIWAHLELDNLQDKSLRLWPRIAVAASLFLIFSVAVYLLLSKPVQQGDFISAKNDIAPGKNTAVLTLANGKKILLNDALNGQLANEAGVTISKAKNGQLVYHITAEESGNTGQFNTLETRNGEQYQVVLPDGSHIWLNAASSLRYPTVFSKKERFVELKGEGYFEIAKSYTSVQKGIRKPFIVATKGQQVEVLGTHFNINAYDDEPISRTTLMEGSVQVSSLNEGRPNSPARLKPGEQAVLVGNQLNIRKANVEEAMAWKNGQFIFEKENIESIMRKITRWYNVEVSYSGELPAETFSGVVNRFENVSQVLRLLSLTNRVNFKIEGRRIIVTK